jgi:putative transposase
MTDKKDRYPNFRFPIAVISQAIWLYNRFPLSYRDVSDLLLQRGIKVSHQTIKDWNEKFGALFAEEIRKRRKKPTGRRHLDEVYIRIKGKLCYLWRAVDDDGVVLDILVTERRNKDAAKSFFVRLFQQYSAPTKITTDRLRSYKTALRETLPHIKHMRGKWFNNRAENSHIPVRERERRMKRFKSPEHAQSFLERFEFIRQHTKPKQHLLPSSAYRNSLAYRLRQWDRISQIPLAA